MLDIKFFEAFEEERNLLRERLPGDIKAEYTSKAVQEAGDKKPPASLISIRTQSVIPHDWAGRLTGILTRSAGFDHLIKYRRETGTNIPSGYLPPYSSQAVAEHAIMMMFVLMRGLKTQTKNFETFDRDGLTGRECRGKNMLIVGVGNIGSRVADLGKGIKMQIKGVDIDPKFKGVEYISLNDGIKWADVLVVAVPLTKTTHAMLNYDLLKNAKPGLVVINIARGEATPLVDMDRLLQENILGGLGLDVFEEESEWAGVLRGNAKAVSENFTTLLRLKKLDNCLMTPHNAFNTHEAVEEKVRQTTAAVEMFLNEGRFPQSI